MARHGAGLGEYAGGSALYNENMAAAWQAELDKIAPGAAQAGAQASTGGDWQGLLSNTVQAAQALITTDAQRRLLAVQLDRARNGLKPLDSSQYGMGVNVGLSPDTLKMIGYGIGGLALVFFLTRKGR